MSVPKEWQMPRPGKTCARCARTFAAGEAFQVHLYETREGYVRCDCCPACVPSAESAPLAVWTTRRPAPAPRRNQPFDRQAIYQLFCRLEDAQEPRKVQLRFLLALLLWRKKILKLVRSTRTDGGETWEFHLPAADETHHVLRPHLPEEQLEQLSAQLEQLLSDGAAEFGDVVVAREDGVDA